MNQKMNQSKTLKIIYGNATIPVMKKRRVCFDETKNTIAETYHPSDYDRRGTHRLVLNHYTASLVKRELDELKTNMVVHPESRCNTVFYTKKNPYKTKSRFKKILKKYKK